MMKPASIRVDLKAEAAYVKYTDEGIVNTVDVWEDGQVAADIAANGAIVGIELLGFDAETLARAREYAKTNGLGFPVDLAGVLVAA